MTNDGSVKKREGITESGLNIHESPQKEKTSFKLTRKCELR